LRSSTEKRYDDWVLPKGKLQEGESFAQAAQREVQEETGCLVTIGEYAGAVGYTSKGSPKVVLFWRMSVLEQRAFEDREEVDRLAWLPMEAAIKRLTHDAEKDFLARISGHAPPPHSSGHWRRHAHFVSLLRKPNAMWVSQIPRREQTRQRENYNAADRRAVCS
jgi:8-oxo-dGTP diphosphatase